MKPTVESLLLAFPDIDARLAGEHLARLDNAYFETFGVDHVGAHLRALGRLSTEHPVELLFRTEGDRAHLTVLAFDYPGEFSLITGVLSGLGFNILSGDIFTYRPAPEQPARRPPRGLDPRRDPDLRRDAIAPDPLRRRRIIDHFLGTIESEMPAEAWFEAVRERMHGVIVLLERGDVDSIARARNLANEMVANRLSRLHGDSPPILYPMDIEVDTKRGPFTILRVRSQDTPGFLYSLSAALALQGIVIEHVRIRTIQTRIEDELDVVDARGEKITDPDALARVKLTVLLTKQFTYFLSNAPNPYGALCRFEQLVANILELPEHGRWLDLLASPRALQDLARILGASDYLWEDLIRQQYEVLLPILEPHVRGRRFSKPREALERELAAALAASPDFEARRRALNEFKDRELFLTDLDHILNPDSEVKDLAAALTALAEVVVNAALRAVLEHLAARFGTPRTVGGLEARLAVFGLGKLGGAALGYASDIELLFVYSDSGRTDGPEPLDNSEFFERAVKETAQFIAAKREGIFHVDLRLRPHGMRGPAACSLENFCRYYGPGGQAHSYERLALVRLRAVGGDAELGAQVERLRDEFVYATGSVDVEGFRALREKQLKEKVPPGRYNAKFSAGALVDLEYDVQLLQVKYGGDDPRLRTPRIHEALRALSEAGVLAETESRQLAEAYYFLRHLVNGLRMLRGSAQDLFLPEPDADEFAHLARRMGYERGKELDPAQVLRLEFETQTAIVRAFVERHFGRDFLPGPSQVTVADLVLSEQVPPDLRAKILAKAGFTNPERAYVNLKALAGAGDQRDVFTKAAVLAVDVLKRLPDPDMALNNWDRFVRELVDPVANYRLLLAQPRRIELLLSLFAGSQFLADTLVRNADFFTWVTDPANLHAARPKDAVLRDFRAFAGSAAGFAEWQDQLRRFRRREILRIGTRDICLKASIQAVTAELSSVAEALTDAAVERVWEERRGSGKTSGIEDPGSEFCILALGKLGGGELNYSSDIDLVGLCRDARGPLDDERELAERELFDRALMDVRQILSSHTSEGYAYRVDFRLRPYGRAGHLVRTTPGLLAYYRGEASLWEIQALLKARPIAGNRELGERFIAALRPILLERRAPASIAASIEDMRQKAIRSGAGARADGAIDIKSGAGGLRDVEFLVQGLQLIHGWEHPEILSGNTLAGLDALVAAEILPADLARQLGQDYAFMRRIEHFLQIMEDRQIHVLPRERSELAALARRVLDIRSSAEEFLEAVRECQARIRAAYAARLASLAARLP